MIDEAFQEIEELGRAEEATQEEAKKLAEQEKKKEKDQEEVKEQEKENDEWNAFEEMLEEQAVLEVLELEREEVILRRFDVGFTKWLNGLTEEKLENVVRRLMEGHENEKTTWGLH